MTAGSLENRPNAKSEKQSVRTDAEMVTVIPRNKEDFDSLFGPVYLIGANVLAGKCGACLPKGHNRKVDEVFYLKVGGKSRHAVYA